MLFIALILILFNEKLFYSAEQVTGSVTGSVMKKLREDFDQKLKLGQPMPSIDLSSKIVLAKEIDDRLVFFFFTLCNKNIFI